MGSFVPFLERVSSPSCSAVIPRWSGSAFKARMQQRKALSLLRLVAAEFGRPTFAPATGDAAASPGTAAGGPAKYALTMAGVISARELIGWPVLKAQLIKRLPSALRKARVALPPPRALPATQRERRASDFRDMLEPQKKEKSITARARMGACGRSPAWRATSRAAGAGSRLGAEYQKISGVTRTRGGEEVEVASPGQGAHPRGESYFLGAIYGRDQAASAWVFAFAGVAKAT